MVLRRPIDGWCSIGIVLVMLDWQGASLRSAAAQGPEPIRPTTVASDWLALSDGRRLPATLFDWDSQGPVFKIESGLLMAGGTEGSTPRPISFGSHREPLGGTRVLLTDGTLLCGEIVSLTGQSIEFRSAACRGELPLSSVRGLLFHPPQSLLRFDRLVAELIDDTGDADRVWLGNGDRMAGVVGWDPQASNAATGRTDLDEVALRFDDQWLAIPTPTIRALGFSPVLHPLQIDPPARFALGFADDGSWLELQNVTLDGERFLELRLACGVTLRSTDRAGAMAPRVDLWSDRESVTRLTNTPPARYRHLPFLSGQRVLGINRTSDARPLRAGQRRYASGLGMHPTSQATFRVPEGMQRIQAELAVADGDPTSTLRGSVRFRVLAQSGERLEERFASPVIRGGDPPVPLDIPISGTGLIVLIVDWADQGDAADEGLWLEARWIP
jgi:hypothetical protein